MRLTELVELETDSRRRCDVCQWRCVLAPGETGRCLVRVATPEGIEVLNDGMISAATFGPIEEHTVRWSEPMSRSRFLDLVRSRSYFITASPEEQASTIAALETLLDTHPDVAGAAELAVPYVTRCFRARLR